MENNYKNKFDNPILVAKKMTLDDPLRKSIEMIDDPQTYFITDNNYVIGNVKQMFKSNNDHQIIPHRIVGPNNLFDIPHEIKKTVLKAGSRMSTITIKYKEEKVKKVQIVNSVELKRIYDNIDSRIKKTDV